MSTVIAIHLVSGHTVLGRAIPSDTMDSAAGVNVAKPMLLNVHAGEAQGSLSISMMPYLSNGVFPVLEVFEFEQQHIIMVREVPTQLEKLYNEMTSGIAIAPAGSRFAM